MAPVVLQYTWVGTTTRNGDGMNRKAAETGWWW
jgi:hypothetical protein